jgi:hypothetical protein
MPLALRSFKLRMWDRHAWIVPATDARGCPFGGPGVTLRGEPADLAFAHAAPLLAALRAFEPGIEIRSLSVDLERPRILATLVPPTPTERPRVVRLDDPATVERVLRGSDPLLRYLSERAAEALARRAGAG